MSEVANTRDETRATLVPVRELQVREVPITWDEGRLKRDRLERLREQMRIRGLGALYLTEGPNVQYVLGMKIPGADVFVPPHGDAIGLVRSRDVGYVKMRHPSVRPPLYRRSAMITSDADTNARTLGQGLADLMAEFGVRGEALGVDFLRADAYGALYDLDIRARDAVPAIEVARSVKTADEVAIYRAIGQQYEKTMAAFRDSVRPGITENELAAIVVTAWHESGGDEILQLNVCSAENMNPWRRWPSPRVLQVGDLAGIDLHGRSASGLLGDISRTFLVGDKASPKQKELYHRAYEYLWASADSFRAGRPIQEALRHVPKVPERFEEQLYDLNVAHTVGMTPIGYPAIDKDGRAIDDTLKPNQILAIECYFGEVGDSLAVKLEEMVVVRDGPPELLGKIPFDEHFET